MRDFAGLVVVVLLAQDDSDRMNEAPDVDSAEVEREEGGTQDQPDDDQRYRDGADMDRIEDQLRDGGRNPSEGLVDPLVDGQGAVSR